MLLAEERLGVSFPSTYRDQILEVGAPSPTRALLDAICETGVDLEEVGSFLTPEEMVEETLSWHQMQVALGYVFFASDGGGNYYCFKASELQGNVVQKAAVYFSDHNDTDDGPWELSEDFDSWLSGYMKEWSKPFTYKSL